MQRIVTLSERKAAETVRRRDAVATLAVTLSVYARAHRGRFPLYGSAARGTMKYGSDVDLLLDFPGRRTDRCMGFCRNGVLGQGAEA